MLKSSTLISESGCLQSVTVEVAGSTFWLKQPSAKQQADKASGLYPMRLVRNSTQEDQSATAGSSDGPHGS